MPYGETVVTCLGLIYRPSGTDSVVLLFASGRVVITGSPDLDAAEQTFAALQDEETPMRRGSVAMGRGIHRIATRTSETRIS